MNHCLICDKKIPFSYYVCSNCYTELNYLKLSGDEQIEICPSSFRPVYVQSIYRYIDPLRELVIQAKVKNSIRSLLFLEKLILENLNLIDPNEFDAVVPAPSSLWGRLRGRFDIAGYIANSIAKELRKPIFLPPASLSFSINKRAKITDKNQKKTQHKTPLTTRSILSGKTKFCNFLKFKTKTYGRILLVDDIVTTGFTITRFMQNIDAESVQVLTLASAMKDLNCRI